jgi:aldose 1-epimerase
VGLPLDACEVHFGGAEYQPVDERLIPDGPPQSVEGTRFDLRTAPPFGDRKSDTAYTGLPFEDGRVWVRLSGGGRTTALWADEAHAWLQLYTADDLPGPQLRAGLATEPMTCPPDAFNSGIDLISLKPDDAFTSSWGIQSQA